MKKIELGQAISILANLGVLGGLALVALELSQNTEQLGLELQWQVNERMLQNNRDMLGDNPARVWAKFTTAPEDLTYEEFQVASALLFNFIGVWEDRYFLHQAGMRTEAFWKDYVESDLPLTLGSRFAQGWWAETKNIVETEVVEFVDERLPEVDTKASYRWYTDTLDRLRE